MERELEWAAGPQALAVLSRGSSGKGGPRDRGQGKKWRQSPDRAPLQTMHWLTCVPLCQWCQKSSWESFRDPGQR